MAMSVHGITIACQELFWPAFLTSLKSYQFKFKNKYDVNL